MHHMGQQLGASQSSEIHGPIVGFPLQRSSGMKGRILMVGPLPLPCKLYKFPRMKVSCLIHRAAEKGSSRKLPPWREASYIGRVPLEKEHRKSGGHMSFSRDNRRFSRFYHGIR